MATAEDSAGPPESHWAFTERWNGSSWTTWGIAAPSEVESGVLEAISCTIGEECTAVGSYKTATGSALALAERYA